MSSETVSEVIKQNLHARAYTLLTRLCTILHVTDYSETRTFEALNVIAVALNTECVRTHALYASPKPSERDDRSFDEALEGHRRQMEHLCEESKVPSTLYLAKAVWWLLALAHQPKEGGVVEIGGNSPKLEMCICGKPLWMCRSQETP